MSSERVLSNARVVSAERVFVGSVLLRDGLIAAVDEGRSHLAGAEDLGGGATTCCPAWSSCTPTTWRST